MTILEVHIVSVARAVICALLVVKLRPSSEAIWAARNAPKSSAICALVNKIVLVS